jgi:predicted peroxiredoxin
VAASISVASTIDGTRIIHNLPTFALAPATQAPVLASHASVVLAVRSRVPSWTLRVILARLSSSLRAGVPQRGYPMQRIVIFLLGAFVGGGLMASVPSGKAHDDLTGALAAPENHPLLVHMTSADTWRGAMGLEFAQAMLKIGHPVAVFLNLDAVKLALRTGEQEKKRSMQQLPRDLVADLVRGGAVVLICQPCLEEFGLRLDDVVPGVQLGRPGYLENFVFADNVRTLTW